MTVVGYTRCKAVYARYGVQCRRKRGHDGKHRWWQNMSYRMYEWFSRSR